MTDPNRKRTTICHNKKRSSYNRQLKVRGDKILCTSSTALFSGGRSLPQVWPKRPREENVTTIPCSRRSAIGFFQRFALPYVAGLRFAAAAAPKNMSFLELLLRFVEGDSLFVRCGIPLPQPLSIAIAGGADPQTSIVHAATWRTRNSSSTCSPTPTLRANQLRPPSRPVGRSGNRARNLDPSH